MQPIVWREYSDFDDSFVAEWCGLVLFVELTSEDRWWWSVTDAETCDTKSQDDFLGHSVDALKKAEAEAASIIPRHVLDSFSESVRVTLKGLLRLDGLDKAGLHESPEADAIREEMADAWRGLAETEKEAFRELSKALYTVSDVPIRLAN